MQLNLKILTFWIHRSQINLNDSVLPRKLRLLIENFKMYSTIGIALSSVRIITVMEKLNAVQEGMEDVNLAEDMKMLADSVALISNTNAGKIVKKRKDLIWGTVGRGLFFPYGQKPSAPLREQS